jgi:hypothetical protein
VNFSPFASVVDPRIVERFLFDPVEKTPWAATSNPTGCHASVTGFKFGV